MVFKILEDALHFTMLNDKSDHQIHFKIRYGQDYCYSILLQLVK